MRDWMRPDRAKALLDMIEQCPTACRWREAASNDEEYMRQSVRNESGKQQAWSPRVSEYDLHSMLLANLTNLVGVLAEGRRIKKYDPIPGPSTVADRIKAEQVMESANSLIAMLTPHALIDP